MSSPSEYWNLRWKGGRSSKYVKFEWKGGNQSKCWNLSAHKLGINQNVEIWVLIRWEIVQNVEIWVKQWGINQKVDIYGANWSKCWNLSAKCQLDIWLKSKESDQKVEILSDIQVGIDQNVEIWLQNVKSIKILKFEYNKAGSIKMLKFQRKRGDWSNVDILLPKWESIKMFEFDWKIRNWSEYWNWGQNWKSIKMLKFEY